MSGSNAARPWPQHQISTIFLRLPEIDWASITGGHKREFRGTGQAVTQAQHVYCPTPVVAYAVYGPPQDRRWRGPKLMVLEKTWTEPLRAISPESLEREGFESVGQFRRYWIARTHKLFMPLKEVRVFQVRPWDVFDEEHMAARLLERLYGEHLNDAYR